MAHMREVFTSKFMQRFPNPHYLLDKDIKDWDQKDYSNFQIIRKIIMGESR